MNDQKKEKCPICDGTGFYHGKVCICISGEKDKAMPDLPEGFEELFGLFGGKK